MKHRPPFTPKWIEEAPKKNSFRSIFKWGAEDVFKHPNDRLYQVIKERLGLDDDHFARPRQLGDEIARCKETPSIEGKHLAALGDIVGEENVSTEDYCRVRYSYGKTTEEAFELRRGETKHLVDAAVHPRNKEDVQRIVSYCSDKRISIQAYGGGSSVTLGLGSSQGGIALVMQTHMNRILELNETNQTATVEAGLMGPDYEDALNNAPKRFGATRSYTCGHFPQSFEYSSVGGWIVTLGSGQQSSYYGDIYDIVLSQEVVTPSGTIKTLDFPGTATGPKINDIFKGSEGTFGILVSATLKIFRFMPQNRRYFGFMFPDLQAAVQAAREISQGEFGPPSMFRVSDGEETELGLKLYGIEGTPIDKLIHLKGFKPLKRCLVIGQADGSKDFTKIVKKNVKKVAGANGGFYLGGYPAKKWEHGRYLDPYMREDLGDYGIALDTLESGVTWDNLQRLHQAVTEHIAQRPNTIVLSHASHFYPQGTNLYFIFMTRFLDPEEYRDFHRGVIARILESGGSLSHHHGVGRMMAPFMEQHLGRAQMDVLRVLKRHFDPQGIFNPGGTLGLD